MAYNHGVYVTETATSLLPVVSVTAGIPFIVGTAPVNMTDPTNVNVPTKVSSYAEAVAAFGFAPAASDSTSGLKKFAYTISEFIYSQFKLFGVGPAYIVNVLDPKRHKASATTMSVTLSAKTGSATVAEVGILPDTVVLTGAGGEYTKGTDYTLSFDEDGYLVVTSAKNISGDFICTIGDAITFSADRLDPTKVSAEDIIGGVSLVTGAKTGLELVKECFPRFGEAPGIILAPGFSKTASVAAAMATATKNINGVFSAICLVDIPTSTVTKYADVSAWKTENNVVDPNQVACWPMLALDGTAFNQSTQLAGLLGSVDGDNDDVPYVSPSNKNYQMNAAVLESGSSVWLGLNEANDLNGAGVVTALCFIGAWKCWGNRTAAYPSNTDVKDSFMPVRRMFSWVGNTFVKTFWQRVDYPLNRRQVDTIVDSANVWLNGLAAKQYILGGKVEFLETDNTTTDLMDGKARFHVSITPPSPNREISFVLEYDPDNLQALFS